MSEEFLTMTNYLYRTNAQRALRPFVSPIYHYDNLEIPPVTSYELQCNCATLGVGECTVHGTCVYCEQSNAVCNCGWWLDHHCCKCCGKRAWLCEGRVKKQLDDIKQGKLE